jgi:hypothetical protein
MNDNRTIYRSRMMLDEDRAARSANLARIYDDAGMSDVAAREAARGVNVDYGNYSAHRFLADSYNPGLSLINRRYETAMQQEFLVANLLSPASAGTFSSTLSRSEYSHMFDENRFGVVSTTEYLSRGAWSEFGAQYGTFEKMSYDLGAVYASDPGQRVNDDFTLRQLTLQLKGDVTPQDTLFLRVEDLKVESGDLALYYDPSMANPQVRNEETQRPNVSLGYHHEWSPGSHTLFLAARLDDTFSSTNTLAPTFLTVTPGLPGEEQLTAAYNLSSWQDFENELALYSVELQQIFQEYPHNTIIGARYQYGDFDTENLQLHPSRFGGSAFEDPIAVQDVSNFFRRTSVYGYHQWNIVDPLQLTVGVSYDRMTLPENFRSAPVSDN